MLTKILSIKGAHEMSREAQKSVKGGWPGHTPCTTHLDCPGGQGCCLDHPELGEGQPGICFADGYAFCDLV